MAAGRLVVCPTPIGNLEDVTLRVLAALRDADVVACEDTRRTRTLLDRYGVRAPLVSYHEHNEDRRAAELVERYRDAAPRGEVVLVVGAAPERAGEDGPSAAAVDAVARLVEAGAKARPAASVVAELTGESANALYAAIAARG